ncbi:hypothetical protein [Streptomyces fragilis]|nr:hypothetical protein [Streptomyces fragilis]
MLEGVGRQVGGGRAVSYTHLDVYKSQVLDDGVVEELLSLIHI